MGVSTHNPPWVIENAEKISFVAGIWKMRVHSRKASGGAGRVERTSPTGPRSASGSGAPQGAWAATSSARPTLWRPASRACSSTSAPPPPAWRPQPKAPAQSEKDEIDALEHPLEARFRELEEKERARNK